MRRAMDWRRAAGLRRVAAILMATASTTMMMPTVGALAAAPPDARPAQREFINQLDLALDACTAGIEDDSATHRAKGADKQPADSGSDCVATEKSLLSPQALSFVASFSKEDDRRHAHDVFAQWLHAIDALGGPNARGEVGKYRTLADLLMNDLR